MNVVDEVDQVIGIAKNWANDEKKLVDTAIVLHELRNKLPGVLVCYYYTSESGKSARYKLQRLSKTFDLRVDLITHRCRLLQNGKTTYETFEGLLEFSEYFIENINALVQLIGN